MENDELLGLLEKRIIRLEEEMWFQEKRLDELDAHVHELLKQQDGAARKIGELASALSIVRAHLDSTAQPFSQQVELPPHYQEQRQFQANTANLQEGK